MYTSTLLRAGERVSTHTTISAFICCLHAGFGYAIYMHELDAKKAIATKIIVIDGKTVSFLFLFCECCVIYWHHACTCPQIKIKAYKTK